MSNKSPPVWIALFLLLVVVQLWLIPALIRAVTDTELLRGTEEQGGDARPVTSDGTFAAYARCNRYLVQSDPRSRFVFPDLPDRSWDLGFNRYMISGVAAAGDDSGSEPATRRYVCRVRFLGGDPSNDSDWKVEGFELLPP